MPQLLININGDVRDTSSLTLPNDRIFRDAWRYNGDVVEIDMTKAIDIRKDQLRADRKERFESLDADYMKALEDNDDATQTAIAAKKKALRDFPESSVWADAQTPEDLKAILLETFAP